MYSPLLFFFLTKTSIRVIHLFFFVVFVVNFVSNLQTYKVHKNEYKNQKTDAVTHKHCFLRFHVFYLNRNNVNNSIKM